MKSFWFSVGLCLLALLPSCNPVSSLSSDTSSTSVGSAPVSTFSSSCAASSSTSATSVATSRTLPTTVTTSTTASSKATTRTTESTSTSAAPSATAEQKVAARLKAMSTTEKVGQMFFVRCRKNTAVNDLKTYKMGVYILYASDFKGQTKDSMRTVLNQYQQAAEIPLLIGVDEEGGNVNRVSLYKAFRAAPFHSPQSLYAQGGFPLVISDTIEKAALLQSLGVNVNLAPVCDVSNNPSDYIYPRTFGKDAKQTAAYVKTVVETMNGRKLGAVLKHFPGYGSNVDTHTGIATDTRPYTSFETADFLPFQAGIAAGAGGVLVSHNIVTCMDETLPASLSPAVHRVLRDTLGFNGVIMTDDLMMEAIKQYTGAQKAAVLAVRAGNDMVLATDFDVQIPAVLAAVEEGTIPMAQIDASVTRILLWKARLGLAI